MKRLKQHHLVLGQKDVDFKTCAQCGMVYTPQKKEDKHLHKIFHKQVLLQQTFSARNQTKTLQGFPKTLQGILSHSSPQKSSLLKSLIKKYSLTISKEYFENDHLWSLVYAGRTICIVWVTLYTNAVDKWKSSNFHHKSSQCDAVLVRLINKYEGSFQLEREPPLNKVYPVAFQVKFIWVHENFRRRKIATEILNTIKNNQWHDVLAFNTPTTVESAFYFAYAHSLHVGLKPITPYVHQKSNNAKLSFYCVLS